MEMFRATKLKEKKKNKEASSFWNQGKKQQNKRNQIVGASKVRQRHGMKEKSRCVGQCSPRYQTWTR